MGKRSCTEILNQWRQLEPNKHSHRLHTFIACNTSQKSSTFNWRKGALVGEAVIYVFHFQTVFCVATSRLAFTRKLVTLLVLK